MADKSRLHRYTGSDIINYVYAPVKPWLFPIPVLYSDTWQFTESVVLQYIWRYVNLVL